MEKESSVRVIKKFPLAIRWNHWINFPIMAIMVWSGLCIYWANADYGISRKWLEAMGLQYRLAQGLSWHWPFAMLFTVNGILYFSFIIFTGHWRQLFPKRTDFLEGLLVAAHDFKIIKKAPPLRGIYNAAQRLTYFFVFVFGVIMVGTGFAIYKPTQLNWLLRLFGGYTVARYIHFYMTIALVLFFLVHIIQVIRSGWNKFRSMITGLEKINEVH